MCYRIVENCRTQYFNNGPEKRCNIFLAGQFVGISTPRPGEAIDQARALCPFVLFATLVENLWSRQKSPIGMTTPAQGNNQLGLRAALLVLLYGANSALLAAEPTDLERRTAAVDAVNLLSAKLRDDGLSHPSGENGQVVVYSTAGLAFLATGSSLSEGPYRREIAKCFRFVRDNAGVYTWEDKAWDQTTWGLAHATIFLAHLHRKATAQQQVVIERELDRCVKLLVEAQADSGGWCHGQHDVDNALMYRDLVGTTNLALFALGLAKQEGVEVPRETLVAALKYILASTEDGHVGYSLAKSHPGYAEPGRNAGAMLAFLSVGADRLKQYPAMRRYFNANVDQQLNEAHGSAQLALLQAAWVSHLLGEEQWDRFWDRLGPSMLRRQDEDGAFIPPEGKESITESGDRATATFALILLLPEGRLGTLK